MITQIQDDEFVLFQRLMYETAGVHISKQKKTLVTNRLRKRLFELKLNDFKTYYFFCQKNEPEK